MDNKVCSANNQQIQILLKFLFYTFLFIFVLYLLVSSSILAIIVKLKKANQFKFEYDSKKVSQQLNQNDQQQQQQLQVYNKTSSLSHENDMESESVMLPAHRDSNLHNKTRRVTLVIANKMYDTRMLSSISLSYVILNTPYFIGMIILLVSSIFADDLSQFFSSEYLAYRLRLQIFILIGEIFMLANFSVTGLVLYFSGQVFRIHAANLLKKFYSFLN